MDEIFVGTESYKLGTGTSTFGTRFHHICTMLYQVPPLCYYGTTTLSPPLGKILVQTREQVFSSLVQTFHFGKGRTVAYLNSKYHITRKILECSLDILGCLQKTDRKCTSNSLEMGRTCRLGKFPCKEIT